VHPHDASVSSVVINGDHLYVGTGNSVIFSHDRVANPDAPTFVVLNKNSGKLIAKDNFKVGNTITHSNWSSPVLAVVDGKKRVFYGAGNGVLYGVDALPPTAVPPKKGEKPLERVQSIAQIGQNRPTGEN